MKLTLISEKVKEIQIKFLVNRLISGGLMSILSYTEKSCIAQTTDNFPRIFEEKYKIKPVLLAFCPSGLYNTGFNLNFHFNIRGKLSMIRCDR